MKKKNRKFNPETLFRARIGYICRHTKIYNDREILNIVKYDTNKCICKSCGKIMPIDFAMKIKKSLEDSK